MDPDSACLAAALLGVPGASDPDDPSLSLPNELTALNDEVLAAVGGAWLDPPSLPGGWGSLPQLEPLRERAQALLGPRPRFSEWSWRDPRICLTLQFWQPLLPELRYVICLRNPLDVASCIQERRGVCQLGRGEAARVWQHHAVSLIRSTAGKPRVFLCFEDLFRGPRHLKKRLAHFSESPRVVGQRARELDLAPFARWHHHTRAVDTVGDPALPAGAKSLYMAMLGVARCGDEEQCEMQEALNLLAEHLVQAEARGRAELAAARAEAGGVGARVDKLARGVAVRIGSAREEPPVIVAGTGGSGTRVVARILRDAGFYMGTHLNEADDALDLYDLYSRHIGRYLLRDRWPLGDAERAAMARTLRECVSRHRAPIAGVGGPWGWKGPPSIHLLPLLHERYPRLKFVHLVRDGRDMAYSSNQRQRALLGAIQLTAPEHRLDPPSQSMLLWSRTNMTAAEYGETRMPDSYLRLRFEDLCASPTRSVARTLAFVGHGTEAEATALAGEHVAAPASLGRWRERDPEQLAGLDGVGEPGLVHFGYSATTSSQAR